MVTGFKDFVLRGNLVELAVAFVVGGAFTTVVTTFTGVLLGFVGKVGGRPDFADIAIADVNVGRFLNAVIAFLVVAAVVYFFVVAPYNKLQQRMSEGAEPVPPAPEVVLLSEIRDLLAERPDALGRPGGSGPG
jgi:large conductance mechanosensitive channel